LERGLKRAAIILSVALVVELVWFFGVTPCLPFSRVEIKTVEGLSEETILRTAGIDSKSSFITVNAATAEHALEALPVVESARVVKRFPDRLRWSSRCGPRWRSRSRKWTAVRCR
jgi:cell division septal protein FtsQ